MKIIFIDRCLNMCFGELLTWEMYYLTDVQSRAVFVKEIFVTQSRITRHWIGERRSINFLLCGIMLRIIVVALHLERGIGGVVTILADTGEFSG